MAWLLAKSTVPKKSPLGRHEKRAHERTMELQTQVLRRLECDSLRAELIEQLDHDHEILRHGNIRMRSVQGNGLLPSF